MSTSVQSLKKLSLGNSVIKMTIRLTINTLNQAIKLRKPTGSHLFRSDQEYQFKAEDFRKVLDKNNILTSYSKPGYLYDNSVTEVFLKSLKLREINRKAFKFNFIERFYNSYNQHSANHELTPNQKEEIYFKNHSI